MKHFDLPSYKWEKRFKNIKHFSMFKYQNELAKVPNCPCHNSSRALSVEAYRFTKSNPPNSDCFLPWSIQNLKQLNLTCAQVGVSMFMSEDSAKQRFKRLEKSNPSIRDRFGKFLAKGAISPNNGRCTVPEKSGHFEFYEFDRSDICNEFKVIDEL